MKKIAVFFISLFIFIKANVGFGICVPGVGYTLVASVGSIASADSGLESVLYPIGSDNDTPGQTSAQINIFNNNNNSVPSLVINLIPEPTLSSYMNLWVPGYCNVDYSSNQTNCTPITIPPTLNSTSSIGDFLKNYSSGHRSYFISSEDGGMSVPVYMPHAKCSNQQSNDDCFLGGNTSVAQPYLNKIDNTIYHGGNYYSALVHKWNASKSGFIFSMYQGDTLTGSVLSLSITGGNIPNKFKGVGIKEDSNKQLYIPILSSKDTILTDFDSNFANYISSAANSGSFDSMKLVCNLFYFPNIASNTLSKNLPDMTNKQYVNYCMNMQGVEYNNYYFNDIRANSDQIKQYVYNLLSCSGYYNDNDSDNDYVGCMAPMLIPNYFKDSNFSGNLNSYYMQSFVNSTANTQVASYCDQKNNCLPKYDQPNWGNDTNVFADYSSTILSLKNRSDLIKDKSTNEPALLINSEYQNKNYSISFVSNCVNDSVRSSTVTFDFSEFIESSDLAGLNQSAQPISISCLAVVGQDVLYRDDKSCAIAFLNAIGDTYKYSDISKKIKIIMKSQQDVSKIVYRVYLNNGYYANIGSYAGVNESVPVGNCAVAEPSINSVGAFNLKFAPTGVCGLKPASKIESSSTNNNNSGKDDSNQQEMNFLFVAPGE